MNRLTFKATVILSACLLTCVHKVPAQPQPGLPPCPEVKVFSDSMSLVSFKVGKCDTCWLAGAKVTRMDYSLAVRLTTFGTCSAPNLFPAGSVLTVAVHSVVQADPTRVCPNVDRGSLYNVGKWEIRTRESIVIFSGELYRGTVGVDPQGLKTHCCNNCHEDVYIEGMGVAGPVKGWHFRASAAITACFGEIICRPPTSWKGAIAGVVSQE